MQNCQKQEAFIGNGAKKGHTAIHSTPFLHHTGNLKAITIQDFALNSDCYNTQLAE